MQKLALTLLCCLFVVPAFAHAFLDEASPRVGSSITEAPKEIRITYTEGVEPVFSHIELFDTMGQPIALGPVARDAVNDKQLFAPLTTILAPGHYEVRWAVVAVDTHHTNGHFTFDYQP